MKGKGTKENDVIYLQDTFRQIEMVSICMRAGRGQWTSVRDWMLVICADGGGAAWMNEMICSGCLVAGANKPLLEGVLLSTVVDSWFWFSGHILSLSCREQSHQSHHQLSAAVNEIALHYLSCCQYGRDMPRVPFALLCRNTKWSSLTISSHCWSSVFLFIWGKSMKRLGSSLNWGPSNN